MLKSFISLSIIISSALSVIGQEYSNYSRQSTRINALAKSYPQLAKVQSLTKTAGGKDIWQITIGTGNTENKPAIAVIGGVEGNHLLGTELAIGFAENLLQGSNSDSIKTLLNKTTFYIYPFSKKKISPFFAFAEICFYQNARIIGMNFVITNGRFHPHPGYLTIAIQVPDPRS